MRSNLARRVATLAATALTATTLLVGSAPAAGSDPVWAPARQATIHPGVQMITNGGQCTANFVFTRGNDVYLGYAAHCAGTGEATDTNGCDAGVLPIGTPVEIQGASQPGTLAYSSWVAMQDGPRPAEDVCLYNDFAVVRVHPADHGKVNPSIPHWGGPTGVNTSGTSALERVYSYGNSSLRFGIQLLSPKTGLSLGSSDWSHPIYTVTPGIPGDSGSAILDSQGRAAGVLSTLAILPLPLSNNASDVDSALAYARANGMSGLVLVPGTEAFNPNKLPLRL